MLKSRKILIVEDCDELLDLLGEALAFFGWETIPAENGRDALDKLECETPSVIFVNVRTPVMNGIELAVSLKAHPAYKKIPILAASDHSLGLNRERCLALGFDDFIPKPLALPELEKRLTNILAAEKRKAIRASDSMNLTSNYREQSS
jgi:CheY-like chemotaxis protein